MFNSPYRHFINKLAAAQSSSFLYYFTAIHFMYFELDLQRFVPVLASIPLRQTSNFLSFLHIQRLPLL